MKRLMLSATGCLLLGLMVQTTCTPTWLSAGEDEQAREVKAQFARLAGRIKSLAVTYRLETKSNLSPEKLRALAEYQLTAARRRSTTYTLSSACSKNEWIRCGFCRNRSTAR
jgi:hypothetical protein